MGDTIDTFWRKEENVLIFQDNGKDTDYGAFGKLIMELLAKHWFVDYVGAFNLYEYDEFDSAKEQEVENLLT